MSDRRIVLFLFVGREKNLRVQMPYWHRLLADWPGLTIELWNMCRNEADDRFVRSLAADRILVRNELYEPNDWPKGLCRRRQARPRWCGCQECKPGQFERPYAIYADDPTYADALFVKADDDIMFWQTDTFGHLFETLDGHPNAVVSARVVNNVVSAKHTPGLREILEDRFAPATQREWFDLHMSAEFAEMCHDWFIDAMHTGQVSTAWHDQPRHASFTRALPGERPSINTIAATNTPIAISHRGKRCCAIAARNGLPGLAVARRLLNWLDHAGSVRKTRSRRCAEPL